MTGYKSKKAAAQAKTIDEVNWVDHEPNGVTQPAQADVREIKQLRETQQTIIAGALFDFMGWLTSRKERIVLSSANEASPAVDAIKDFAKMRGLSLDDAKVQDWNTAQSEQDPIGYAVPTFDFDNSVIKKVNYARTVPLYTTPPQRPWVGLTDEEHIAFHDKFVDTDCYGLLIDAVEAKLKEKNT